MVDALLGSREQSTVPREIESQIQALLDSRSTNASAYGPQFTQLWRVASQCVTGGKLLRPRILMGVFDAFDEYSGLGAGLRVSALRISAAFELLHFSFLLHDDVIDEDLHRRGNPNLIARLLRQVEAAAGETSVVSTQSARHLHWARSCGILVGDLMLSASHQVFAREAVNQTTRVRLLDLLDHTITESVAGEHCDVGLSDGVIASDLSTVLEMTRMKTATYTFEFPLRAAAILADAGSSTEDALGKIGRHLGVAFQLQDDLLSAFGGSEGHGKDSYSDFREGKETAIIAYARMTHAWPSIEPLLGASEFTIDDGKVIQSLLTECEAERFVRSMAQDQMRAALDILAREESTVPPAASRFILSLVDTLEVRDV